MTEQATTADLDQQFESAGGTVRIPGERGELVILHSVLMIRRLADREELALGLDVVIDDPSRSVRYRNRPITVADLVNLRSFLSAAMTEFHPEVSVPAFQSESAGLVMSVVASSELSVLLEVGVVEDIDEPDSEVDALRLDVARVALGEPVDIADSMIYAFATDDEQAGQ